MFNGLNVLVKTHEKFGLPINANKTKTMVQLKLSPSNRVQTEATLKLDNVSIEPVESFNLKLLSTYSGSLLNNKIHIDNGIQNMSVKKNLILTFTKLII